MSSKKTNSHKKSRSQKGGVYPFDTTTSVTETYTAPVTTTSSSESSGSGSVAMAVSFVVGGIVGFVTTYIFK